MARGSKKKYTKKQKRKASKIEKSYKKRGVSKKEAEKRAWATVNKSDKGDRKSTRLNSSHGYISYAVFCLKKKKKQKTRYVCSNGLPACTQRRSRSVLELVNDANTCVLT